jgi:hypothetical protein
LCDATSGSYASAAACATDLANFDKIWGSKQGEPAGTENSLECRIYHAIVGNTTPPHCSHVFANSTQCSTTVTTNADPYCTTINAACTGAVNGQYNNQVDCVRSFAAFPAGNAVDTNAANDQGCRQYHAQAANILGVGHCTHAGPSGGGVCGGTNSSRESWRLMSGVCGTIPFFTNQQAAITAAFNNWAPADFRLVVPNVSTAFTTGSAGNTDLCRIYHLTVATQDPTHCNHGSLLGGNNCGLITDNICNMIKVACPLAYPVATDCTAAFGAMLLANKTGDANALTAADDSVACRVYQAGLALATKKLMGSTFANCGAVRTDKFFNTSATVGCLPGPAGAAPTSGVAVVGPALAGALMFLVW